jgi:hypothetical protein
MSFLSTGELTQLRADADKTLLDETCTILTQTASANAIGEKIVAWSTAGTSVPCRLRPTNMPPYPQSVAGQTNTIAQWFVTLPHGSAVAPGSRLVIDSATYEVVQSWDEGTWKTATRVNVTRIE